MSMIVCKHETCSNTFDSTKYYNQVFCSKECKEEYFKLRKRKARAIAFANRPEQFCPICDTKFVNTSHRPKIYCSDKCCRRSARKARTERHHESLKQIKTCACRECKQEFETILATKMYCSNKCGKRENLLKQRDLRPPKPKVVKVKKPKEKKKKQYTPISKPERKKRVVMALSKEVINCLEPEKPKAKDEVFQRDYTDRERDMIEQFLKAKS